MINVPSEYPDLVVGARYGDTPLTVGSVIPVTSTVTLEVGSAPVYEKDNSEEFIDSESDAIATEVASSFE